MKLHFVSNSALALSISFYLSLCLSLSSTETSSHSHFHLTRSPPIFHVLLRPASNQIYIQFNFLFTIYACIWELNEQYITYNCIRFIFIWTLSNSTELLLCFLYAPVIVQWFQNEGRCGVCGDAYHLESPRPHEAGGLYARGIISKFYTVNQVNCSDAFLTFLLNFRKNHELISCRVLPVQCGANNKKTWKSTFSYF